MTGPRNIVSTGLACAFVEFQPQRWYYLLEEDDAPACSWDWREHAEAFGPFATQDAAVQHLSDNHPNPGGWSTEPYSDTLTQDEILCAAITNAQAPLPTAARK
jgi:hypothetical protein